MNQKASKWLGATALLFASGLSVESAVPLLGSVAKAAPSYANPTQPTVNFQGGPIRRESLPPTLGGAERLSGPVSAFQALIDPVFGTNYRANTDPSPTLAQQEPSIAVNPLNPLNVVAAAKDEREGTNSKHVYIYTSTDGGVTWINQRFPYREPTPGFSSDPVVNFSDDGICYVTSLPYGSGTIGIQVARSNDGGITFQTGTQVTSNSGSDKEWTWIDNYPSSPYYHRMYVAWRNFGGGPAITLNYSTDRGATWSSDVSVAGSAYQFPMPIVAPSGDVLVTYLSSSNILSYARSTNGGVTFGAGQTISGVSPPLCPPDNAGCGIWRLATIPVVAVNPINGNIVVVWPDSRPSNTASTYFSRSTDNGATWSTAAQLAPPGVANTYQVEPWVEADEQGIFHAIWYDNRETPNTSVFHIYYSQSTDNGQTWTSAQRISTASSDLRIGVPSGYNRAAGDYIQVTASQGNVYAAWTDTRSGTGEDIFVVRGVIPITSTPTLTPSPTLTQIATATASRTSTLVPPTITSTVVQPSHTSIPPTSTATSTSTFTISTPSNTPVSSTATSTTCPIRFADVDQNNTFYTSIRCLACQGIVSGYADGTFRPNNNVTRGQISKIVSNSAGYPEPIPSDRQTFEDVPATHTFWLWIERLYARGPNQIISGYPCGAPGEPCITGRSYFRPQNNVTRGQLAKIAATAAGFAEPPTGQTFQDVPSTSTFYSFIQRLASRDVMQGYPCGSPGEPCIQPENKPYFRPNNDVTRGQSAKIVANTFFPGCNTP